MNLISLRETIDSRRKRDYCGRRRGRREGGDEIVKDCIMKAQLSSYLKGVDDTR
jgi:hypothetical protein